MFYKVIHLFRKLLQCPLTSLVTKTFAYLALVMRAHYAIRRHMFTVGFQFNFRHITPSFSAGRR